MPFTFAHPAIVLPLAKLSKHWVSITGLIVGSMTPDFEYFLRMRVKSIYSHTWPGLFWFDVPLGLCILIIYQFLIKDSLIEHLPTSLYSRFVGFKGTDKDYFKFQNLIVVLTSILIGTLSHILWDGFTHPTGYFVKLIPNLSSDLNLAGHNIAVYKIIQHVSTLIGLVVICVGVFSLKKSNKNNENSILIYWICIGFVACLTVIIGFVTGLKLYQYGDLIVCAVSGSFLGLFITSTAFKLKIRPIL
ncbi:DUF4184 family protein [Mucilaginibacter mali]|uniref:DUF4184 family protein n=1 Tax=Mucilaginibacter mali TaxID=2740462 RepID=A0A7D4TVA3_9SPHI|nr:DUF4184 family protein [Mucilaginibacter mali]QKJ28397.1 DUF4184 family protein [Mucilaginibacter mali]